MAMIGPPNSRAALIAACMGAHPFVKVPVDVLDHDDRVVDDQTDRQHQRQEGQQIDREAEGQHHHQGADERHRDCDGRDHHRAQRAKEDEHDDDHDQHGFSQAADHLVDRAVHEIRRIVDHRRLETLRQLRLDFGQRVVHSLDDRQEIGGRRDLDTDIDRVLAVEGDAGVVSIGAERHVGDVLQPDIGAVRLLDDQVAELVERMEIGRRVEIYLHHLALGRAKSGDVVIRRASPPPRPPP